MGTRLFLHKVDAAKRTGTFVRTSAPALRDAAFLDGRTRYWEESPVEQDIATIVHRRHGIAGDRTVRPFGHE